MSRSLKKGPFVSKKLYERIVEMNTSGQKKPLKTWSRCSTIFRVVGHTINVHNGKPLICYVTENLVGLSWAIFLTRTFRGMP